MKGFVRIIVHWNVSVVQSLRCINVFLPSTFFLISSSDLKGSYATLTCPGWIERSISLAGLKIVPGMFSLTAGKNAFLCAELFFCQSSQILSMKASWRKNSGAEEASESHMVAPIPQCTFLCIIPLRASSKSVKLCPRPLPHLSLRVDFHWTSALSSLVQAPRYLVSLASRPPF